MSIVGELRQTVIRAALRFRYGAGVQIGAGARFEGRVDVLLRGGRLELGERVVLRSRSAGYHVGMPFPCGILADREGATIRIGKETRINGAYVHGQRSIEIGERCVIAAGVNIIDSNGHVLLSRDRTRGRDEPGTVVIGDNVWIAVNAVILKNTRIGANSVVSANSVVQGDFPENSLIVGNPAVVARKLEMPAPGAPYREERCTTSS